MDAARGGSAARSVDRSGLGMDALLDLVPARARLLWQVQGELLADLAQVVAAALSAEPGEDADRVVGAVGELVGWTLHWSTGYAQGQVELGVVLARRLPMVLTALREGQIDQAKAAAFADALGCVEDDVAARVAARLLPKARTWTLRELRAALRYHVDRADPGAARRRYRRRVAERDVWLRAQPDGTADLSGRGLAPHRAAAAYDRIDRIARAARAGGDVRTLAQLRADALCDVLTGVPFQLTPTTDPLCAEADLRAEGRTDGAWSLPGWRTESRFPTRKPGGGPNGDGRLGGPDDGGGHSDGGGGSSGDPNGEVLDLYDYDRACLTDEDRAWVDIGYEPPGAADNEDPAWWQACQPPRTEAEDSRSENRNVRPDREDLVWALAQADAVHLRCVLSPDVLAGDRCACGGLLRSVRLGTVDLQVKLTTLAGLDEHPALISGLGVTTAATARQIAFDPHTRPSWRWSIFDNDGELLHHGQTRHRPIKPESRSENRKTGPGAELAAERTCTCQRIEPGPRRGSIELQLTLATLHELLTDPQHTPGWQPLLADVAAQVEYDRRINPPGKWHQTDRHGRLRSHGHTARMPDAAEEAFIRARDRSCRAPHCPIPANRCELDHRIEYAKGGPSHRGNVDARCKRHHHQRERGYQITRTGDTTTWTGPSGRSFTITTEKDLILTREE